MWLTVSVQSVHGWLAPRQKGMEEKRCSTHDIQEAERQKGAGNKIRPSRSQLQ